MKWREDCFCFISSSSNFLMPWVTFLMNGKEFMVAGTATSICGVGKRNQEAEKYVAIAFGANRGR